MHSHKGPQSVLQGLWSWEGLSELCPGLGHVDATSAFPITSHGMWAAPEETDRTFCKVRTGPMQGLSWGLSAATIPSI